MDSKVATQALVPRTTEPLVEPSVPTPQADPLHDVRDVVNAIRIDSAVDPREYLDEIRVLLGAE